MTNTRSVKVVFYDPAVAHMINVYPPNVCYVQTVQCAAHDSVDFQTLCICMQASSSGVSDPLLLLLPGRVHDPVGN